MPFSEKRMHARQEYSESCVFRVMGSKDRLPGKYAMNGKIIDVADGGVGVSMKTGKDSPRRGDVVLMRVPLPDGPATIPTLAAVRWTKAGKGEVRAGLKFVTG